MSTSLMPLEGLYEATQGAVLPLPPELEALYGPFRLTSRPERPLVLGNFVTTLDGVVALDRSGRGGGSLISGSNEHDRLLMGLLRAVADAVVVGAGTLRSVPRHLWTPEYIYPPFAAAYRQLRAALSKPEPPLNVIVTARGEIDPDARVLAGQVPVLIVTTAAGEACLARLRLASNVSVEAVSAAGAISASAVLGAIGRRRASRVVLVEGGPYLIGHFFAERLLDELFLTLSPQVAGRDGAVDRPGLVAGKIFAPTRPLWATLVGVKRGGSHLFLRYSFASPA